jgi:polysaccharide deacetylase family protein (PEP-CTERM system associated)
MNSSHDCTTHFFTVDVEEYFQVQAFESAVTRDSWASRPSRVAASVDVLLERLARHGARGTFFVLGWIAVHRPRVVEAIAAAGHEIASHGFWHRRVLAQRPADFREDVRAARQALEDLTGAQVRGYRAPSFSIVPGCEWAFDILLEEGYEYDSSLFPIRRRGYGYPTAERSPHLIHRESGSLAEFPLATTRMLGWNVPAAGGGYLRQLPLGITQRAFREATARDTPATFYIHPWEIDPGQPTLAVSASTRLRHYRGLGTTLSRIDELLAEFPFTAIDSYLPQLKVPVATIPAAFA